MSIATVGAWNAAYRWGARTIMARNAVEAIIALFRISIWLFQLGVRWWKRQDAPVLLRNLHVQTGRRLNSIGTLVAFYVALVVLQAVLFTFLLPIVPTIFASVFVGTLIGKHGVGKLTKMITSRLQ